MAKLTRVKGKVFGGSAPLSQIGQFGSALAGTPTNTQDVATIQALSAYDNGWGSAVITSRNFPPIEEVNGVLKTISYQNCYLLQEGIPTFDITTEYSNTSVVKSVGAGGELILYVSLQDGNIGHQPGAEGSENYWTRAVFIGSSAIGVPQFTLNYNLVDPPENCIWLEGAEISRTTYSTLFGIYGTTYGEGDGSTTFNLPDFRNRVLWGGETAGYISAGLPNVIQRIGKIEVPNFNYPQGDMSDVQYNRTWPDQNFAGDSLIYVSLNLSKSNSIYGNSTTVQPPAIKCRVYTRYQ